jgi:hypothetical protein
LRELSSAITRFIAGVPGEESLDQWIKEAWKAP